MNLAVPEHSLFLNAFHYALGGMALLDRDGFFLKVNPSFCDFLGYSEEELLRMNVQSLTYPEDLQADLNRNRMLFEGNLPYFQMEKRYLHRNGHTVWGLLSVSVVHNDRGEPSFTVAQVLDKTRDKKTEEAMNRLLSLYQHTTEGIAIFDLEGHALQANPAFERIFGYAEGEVIGKRLPVTPEATLGDAMYLLRETARGRLIDDYETVKQRKDGSLITVSITMSPIRDGSGRIYALAGIVRDITERKQKDHELLTAKLQLDSFINNNQDPIFIFNQDDRLIRVNQAVEAAFGWTAEELLGKHAGRLPLISADRQLELKRNRRSLKSGQPVVGFETVRYRKDGTELHVSISIFTMSNNQWAAIIRDVTERKQAEEVLVRTEKLSIAGQLAAGVAHEIRNPVTAIKGFLQLMNNGMDKTRYLEIMSEEIERIELILSELLVLAKPQASRFERKNLKNILTRVIALLDAQANLNNTEISLVCDGEYPVISCDDNQLKQVFINMIKNAIEAMPEGGRLQISLHTKEKPGFAVLRFADEGRGIPKHVLAQLGSPFYTTKEKGTGLGFMVSQRIIENHGGAVRVTSEEGVGTVVEVLLPA